MTTSSRVRILLPTYNSSRYLRPQLDSLLAQDSPDLEILIRDDGSTDETLAILAAYAERAPQITVRAGPNIGVVAGFFTLLREPLGTVGYVAFCDHDDVWHRDKLSRAVSQLALQPTGVPAVYCSRARLVTDDGTAVGYTPIPRRGPSFENALVENVIIGCTAVFNRRAAELLLQTTDTRPLILHDWWSYLVMSALGSVIYDPESRIDYRQHPANAIGAPGVRKRWELARDILSPSGRESSRIRSQVREFWRTYGSLLDANKRRIVEAFLSTPASTLDRLRWAASSAIVRQRFVDELVVRALMTAGRI